MVIKVNTLRPDQINRLNTEFWAKQQLRMDRQVADDTIRKVALGRLDSEFRRNVPVYYQISLAAVLEEVEAERQLFLRQFSTKGGKVEKIDALQALINDYVAKDPKLTTSQLREKLTKERHPEAISDVADGEIWFGSVNGHLRSASIAGLKDR